MFQLSKQNKIIAGIAVGTLVLGTGFIIYKKNKNRLSVTRDINNYGSATVGTINVIETAQQLGMDLGIAYSVWNPQSWTENDRAVLDTLLAFPKTLIPRLMSEYNKKYQRNLQLDVQKLLPASYYAQIRSKFI